MQLLLTDEGGGKGGPRWAFNAVSQEGRCQAFALVVGLTPSRRCRNNHKERQWPAEEGGVVTADEAERKKAASEPNDR